MYIGQSDERSEYDADDRVQATPKRSSRQRKRQGTGMGPGEDEPLRWPRCVWRGGNKKEQVEWKGMQVEEAVSQPRRRLASRSR